MKKLITIALLFTFYVALTACKEVDESQTKQPIDGLPQLTFALSEINSRFEVELPTTDENDQCSALRGVKKICLVLDLHRGDRVTLSGALGESESGCAEAYLTAEVDELFDGSDIDKASLLMLNSESAECTSMSITQGGRRLGQTVTTNHSVETSGIHQFAMVYQTETGANLYENSLPAGLALHTATTLANGNLLVTGGMRPDGLASDRAYIYDPNNMTFSKVGPLNAGRYGHVATLITDTSSPIAGYVVIAGGSGSPNAAELEIYNPTSQQFNDLGAAFETQRYELDVKVLPNSKKLLYSGGYDGDNLLTDSVYGLDLISLTLEKAGQSSSDGGAGNGNGGDEDPVVPAITHHTSVVLHPSNTGDANLQEVAIFLTGITDVGGDMELYRNTLSYLPSLNEFFESDANNPALPSSQARYFAASVNGNRDTQIIFGGLFAAGIRSNALTIFYDGQIAEPEILAVQGATMATPRFAAKTLTNQQSKTSTHLVVGGGRQEQGALQASRAVEYLVVDHQDPHNPSGCFGPWLQADAVTGDMQPAELVAKRYGASVNQLTDGKIVVIGGYDGTLNASQGRISIGSAERLLNSVEILTPSPSTPSCP